MKKIERLHHEERNGDYRREISSIDSIIDTVNSLVDSNNELLETHTVKEACMRCTCGKGSCIDCGRKEQPTTPEIIITGLQYKVVSQPTTPENMCSDESMVASGYIKTPSGWIAHGEATPAQMAYHMDWVKSKKKPEKKPHTEPMKKCDKCSAPYCPECFKNCPVCSCNQGESEKRNDIY